MALRHLLVLDRGDFHTWLSERREGGVCDAFGVVGVELQSVVDGDDPFGLLAWRQFGRTVKGPGLSGAVVYPTSSFDAEVLVTT
jgi:hypothetical protein